MKLQIIRVYYDIKSQKEYTQFLFNHIVRDLLEQGDLRLTKNINQYQGKRYLKFVDSYDNEIEIFCTPLSETAVKGHVASTVYIQNIALYKTSQEILDIIPTMFRDKQPEVYIFDGNEVLGKWNTN